MGRAPQGAIATAGLFAGGRARPEHALLFTVTAWDVNCPQHIPQRFDAADVAAKLEIRDQRIAALEVEVQRLRRDSNPSLLSTER